MSTCFEFLIYNLDVIDASGLPLHVALALTCVIAHYTHCNLCETWIIVATPEPNEIRWNYGLHFPTVWVFQ